MVVSQPGRSPTEGRVYFRDVKPYAVVDSLDDLHEPPAGVVELSHSVLWAPGGGRVDLDEPGGTALAYQAVLAEGTAEDLTQVLNRDRLTAVWSDLMLPARLRQMWESRFPELRPATAAQDRGSISQDRAGRAREVAVQ